MYLEPWMIVMLVITFGACAILSRRGGFYAGSIQTLQMLEANRLIKVDDEGNIKRWAPYNDTPVKKNRAKKVK